MAYNFFTQGQGPQIDISLFGDASTAGIAAGKALPTKTTAILNGLEKGITTGMSWLDTMQQMREREYEIAIKEHQLSRIGQTDQIQDLQLKKAELDLKETEQTTDADIAAKKAELARKQAYDERRKYALDLINSGDSNRIMNELKSIGQVLNRNEFVNTMDALGMANDLTPENRKQWEFWNTRGKVLGTTQALQKDSQLRAQRALERSNADAAADAMRVDSGYDTNVPMQAFVSDYEIYPSGSLKTKTQGRGSNTFQSAYKSGNNWAFNTKDADGFVADPNSFMIINKSGRVIYDNASKNFAEDFRNIKGHVLGGTTEASLGELTAADAIARKKTGVSGAQVDYTGKSELTRGQEGQKKDIIPERRIAFSIQDKNLQEAAKRAPKAAEAYKLLETKRVFPQADLAVLAKGHAPEMLEDFVTAIEEDTAFPKERKKEEFLKKSVDLSTYFARAILRERFKKPEIQNNIQYSDKAVDYENAKIKEGLMQSAPLYYDIAIGEPEADTLNVPLYEALKIPSREELYIRKNEADLAKSMQDYLNFLEQQIRNSMSGKAAEQRQAVTREITAVNDPSLNGKR